MGLHIEAHSLIGQGSREPVGNESPLAVPNFAWNRHECDRRDPGLGEVPAMRRNVGAARPDRSHADLVQRPLPQGSA
jgi:hypothetical protein